MSSRRSAATLAAAMSCTSPSPSTASQTLAGRKQPQRSPHSSNASSLQSACVCLCVYVCVSVSLSVSVCAFFPPTFHPSSFSSHSRLSLSLSTPSLPFLPSPPQHRLHHSESPNTVKKKAALAMLRLFREAPEQVNLAEYSPRIVQLLTSPDTVRASPRHRDRHRHRHRHRDTEIETETETERARTWGGWGANELQVVVLVISTGNNSTLHTLPAFPFKHHYLCPSLFFFLFLSPVLCASRAL